uniref:Tubulin--tyrosine ligase-like protein 12 SET-like domain-containing protein n=1 Tax=Kalanchoe fedtschenkoi TaxID=63787 RepID=A0A7N0TS93_KALFE
MADSRIRSFEDFVKVHAILLAASGIPNSLHLQLFRKLSSDVFDAGSFFRIEPCHSGTARSLVLTSEYMQKESCLFLVDHAWTFRLTDAPKHEAPGLVERMASIMCADIDLNPEPEEEVDGSSSLHISNAEEILETEIQKANEKGNGIVRWIELEDLDLDDNKLVSLDLCNKFPDLYALSLRGNKLHDKEIIIQLVTKFKNLRALWLNDNPVLQKDKRDLEEAIIHGCPRLEVLNSHFTDNYGEWALGFCGDIYDKANPGTDCPSDRTLEGITSLDLSSRGIHNLAHKLFSHTEMPHLSHLNLRENPLEQTSCHQLLSILSYFTELQTIEVDIPGPLGANAWEILESLPNISTLNGVDASKIIEARKQTVESMLQPRLPEWTAEDSLVVRVLNAMWLYLLTYRLADDEKLDETSVWYMMDELGSALRHSDVPNFRVAPFLYMPDGNLESAVSFSILWPIQDVYKGSECTRDFLFGIGEDKQRSARLTAWFHTPESYFMQEYQNYCRNLGSKLSSSYHGSYPVKSLSLFNGSPLRVYTDIPQVEEFLTRPEFSIISEPAEADIIWTCMQIDDETKNLAGITNDQHINQFPFEACLVMKHHLAETVQKVYGHCGWFQTTYNLETDLSSMIGDYFIRKKDGLDNLWILKPWNMARTIDTTVTDDLSAIIRLMETGPKICQKYIEHPALFKGRKFDLRYIVLVRSIRPLEIFLCDVFWARLSNNPYSLDKLSFFEYETHFTVMNYGRKLNHMNTPEFVKEFEAEHQVKWLDIHQRIIKMIRMLFEAAAVVQPDMHNQKSRAIYGLDVMLDSSFQPKLLEVTYCPDCMRACKYDTEAIMTDGRIVYGRDFFNTVFGCLFLNENSGVTQL